MKKYLFILATAAIVASCAENDSFKEINTQGNGDEAISFTSYTSKATRAENSNANYSWTFYTHQPDFIVYAYKNPNNAYGDQVFSGQIITMALLLITQLQKHATGTKLLLLNTNSTQQPPLGIMETGHL